MRATYLTIEIEHGRTGSKLLSEHEQGLEQGELSGSLSGLRQVSVTRRVDSCDPGRERERGRARIHERFRCRPLAPYPRKGRRRRGRPVSFAGEKSLRLVLFGCMRTRGLLEKNGTALKIGSRALDILITLLEHAPEVVSKRDLIRRVWGQLVVDEVSLPVQVNTLRKQLGDGDSSVSHDANCTIPGRGYCFAGAVSWQRLKRRRQGHARLV